MLQDFAAIDFETANRCRQSVCSVGIVIVRGGKITDTFYSLIHPTPDYYSQFCTAVHGLTSADTDGASDFPHVWEKVEELIEGLPLVAHNSPFDEGCLRAVFAEYGLPYPNYRFYCTLRGARMKLRGLPNYQLHTVSAVCGYNLANHHHALADAEACAHIALKVF